MLNDMTFHPLKERLRKEFSSLDRIQNRELSWLDFNDRVMEEARDPQVPVLERLKFLAIVASNLDEFFMVRVAFVRRQIEAGIKRRGPDGLRPVETLERIVERVHRAHESIGDCFRTSILPDLARHGMFLITDTDATAEQRAFARHYHASTLAPLLTPLVLDESHPFPELENGALYFCVEVMQAGRAGYRKSNHLGLLRLPTPAVGRFVKVPSSAGTASFMLVDDILRLSLDEVFGGEDVSGCYEIKIVRDSELDLDEVGSSDLLRSILEGLQRRRKGPATRFLYDPSMPADIVERFAEQLRLSREHVFPGARNHSFADFIHLPSLIERPDLMYPPAGPLSVPRLEGAMSIYDEVQKGDVLLQHPYQSFSYVARFFEEAAGDPRVVAIKSTLYRTSSDSRIASALARAARNGKQVTVLIELKARFDEERNIGWARTLEEAGAQVVYGVKGLKTHCKMALVVRKVGGEFCQYCHLGTGNYNDRTARVYSDFGLLTAHKGIAADVSALFNRMTADVRGGAYTHLLMAPEHMREGFVGRIRREAENARLGVKAGIVAKMNALVDPEMIDELYLASQSGVTVRLIVRGICCLRPGIPGLSENIEVCSIIDRYLEHARVYRFENGGAPELFLSSADWMPRNLNNRIEVAFPVYDNRMRSQVEEILELQLSDTVKARLLRADGGCVRRSGERLVRSQFEQYELVRNNAG